MRQGVLKMQCTRRGGISLSDLQNGTAAQAAIPFLFWQHSTIAASAFGGYFLPIHRFEKFEVHKVYLHFSNLVSTKNISPNALAKSCGAALCFRKRRKHGIQQRSLLLRRRRQLWQQLLKQSGMHLRHAARQKRLRLVRPEHANAKFPFHTIPPRASYAGAAGLIPAASRRAPRAPRRAPLQTSGAGAWLPAAGGPSCRWQWPD